MRLGDAAAMWAAGMGIGLSTMRREPVLGLKRILLPSSYWRTAEFAYVFRQLQLPPGARVLDLGSPKDLAAMLARRRGYQVTATDILPEAVQLSERYARAQGIAGDGPGLVRSEVQDGRSLTYPDGHFDAAFSVSVLEHIPDHGDTAAIHELVRVVRPGGRVVVTTPYAEVYRETFVSRPVYERESEQGKPVFWERHYDADALDCRLLRVPGTRCRDREIWGEGPVRMERALDRLEWARTLLSPLEAAFAAAFLRQQPDPRAEIHPMAAFFALERNAVRSLSEV